MTASPATHLSADELDAIHAGISSVRMTSHLETCRDCQSLLALDTRLIAALEHLPTWDPSPQFVARVMSQVERPAADVPALVTLGTRSPRERSAQRRVVVASLLTAGVVTGGFAWAFVQPDTAIGLVRPAFEQLTGTLWTTLQAFSANTVEQPWFSALRDALATPARAVPVLFAAAGLYAVTLLGLRRLLTRPAADAGW
jgi:type VI protein secretion system component VasK